MMRPQQVQLQKGIPAIASLYICVCDNPSKLQGIICRVEAIDEHFFYLWSSDPARRYPQPEEASPTPSSLFVSRFRLAHGDARCFMLLACTEEAADASAASTADIRRFSKYMPRPNVSFLRAFSVQLLRGLGYCHSCKLTSHNGKSL
jgi:hypothetical protein